MAVIIAESNFLFKKDWLTELAENLPALKPQKKGC